MGDQPIRRMVDREIDNGQAAQLVALSVMILSLPQRTTEVDAILVLPGQGEDLRLTQAIEAWNTSPNVKHLLVAGNYNGETTWFEPTLDNLSEAPYGLVRKEGVVIQPHAHHTKEQGEWIAATARDLRIESIALVVSPYHLTRAYLTFVKCFEKLGIKVALYPAPVRIAPDVSSPETGLNSWQYVPGEVERVLVYQEKGDVATYEELQGYLEWLWKRY